MILTKPLGLPDRIAIMKDGIIEQLDTPAKELKANKISQKFTEEIDKSRVVKAAVLVDPKDTGTGTPVDAEASIHSLARMLIGDNRKLIPVERDGKILGCMSRAAALDILLGAA